MKYLLLPIMILFTLSLKAQSNMNKFCAQNPWHWKCEDYSNPLPVTITSFTSQQTDKAVILNWEFIEPQNHSHFVILHSDNNKDFTLIGETDKTHFKHYPDSPNNYYLLLSIDNDGIEHFYKVIHQYFYTEYVVYDIFLNTTTIYYRYKHIPRDRFLIINNIKTIIR